MLQTTQQLKGYFFRRTPKDHKNIVGGDFNCVESLDLDTLNHSNASCTLVGHQELRATVADFELEDRWRVENPKCRQYTWSNKTGTQASRLDKFFVPTDLTIDNCSISVFPFSDHKLVNIVLSMNQASACFRSKVTHWKLNTTILHEDDYKQKVRILIRDMATLMDAYADVTEWWDDLKARIKVVTISYCSKRKMKLKQKFEDLKAKLDTCSPGKEYAILKDQLRDMYEARFRITNIQSNIERDLMDEKCNSYFF